MSRTNNYHRSLDLFDTVLDGCILAAISFYLHPNNNRITQFDPFLETVPSNQLSGCLDTLSAYFSDLNLASCLCDNPDNERDTANESLLLFIQQGLVFRTFHRAIRQGDTGPVRCCLKFITVWFQASDKRNYRAETLRLIACLEKIWSPELQHFWMDNCVVNLSGKKNGFMPLDMLNEYIVREVKRMMHPHVTPETDEWLREVVSVLIMIFWDVRRKIAEETDSEIFDYHSSKVSPWKDISRVTDKVLRDQLCTHNVDRLPAGMKYTTKDMFVDGLVALANTKNIEALKKAMRVSDGSDWDEPDDEDGDELTWEEDSGTEDDHEREESDDASEDEVIDNEEDRLSNGWITD